MKYEEAEAIFEELIRTDNQESFPVSKLWSVSEDRFWKEIEKCQVLCHDCHEKKSFKELGYKKAKGVHGRYTNYKKHGCRCKKCVDAYRRKMRQYNSKSRRKKMLKDLGR